MMGVLSRPRPGQNRRYAYGFASTLARNTSRVGYPNHTHFIGQTHVGVRTCPEPPAVLRHRSRAVMLISLVGLALDPQILLKPLLCLQQPRGSRAWNRLSL